MLPHTDPEISIKQKCINEETNLEAHERMWIIGRLNKSDINNLFLASDEDLMYEARERGLII